MDGIETTEKLRQLGYKGVIVALTANALAGNDEMFSRHGFDGFIPKPIDILHLNTVLNKFIRDRHPEEAKMYHPQETVAAQTTASAIPDEKRKKLLKVFCHDAEKAITALRKSTPQISADGTTGDIKLLTITAHAMKSALANVGEIEKSQQATELEKAGRNGDTEFIAANTEAFIQTLESLIQELNPAQPADTDADAGIGADVMEDTAYLAEQLQIIKAACKDYDDTEAYAALDRLKAKQWKPQTTAALEEIHDALFLHSDFDGVRAIILEQLSMNN